MVSEIMMHQTETLDSYTNRGGTQEDYRLGLYMGKANKNQTRYREDQ